MKTTKITDYVRGWFIGDFEPSVLRVKDFEVGVLTHKKGEKVAHHYHKDITEYNLLISGKLIMQGQELNPGDLFILERGEVADPLFIEDCSILCVKVPSIPSDKFEV